MSIKVLDKNEILFRQGDPGDGMYYIHFGKVGIFFDYGTDKQVKIEELYSDQFVGEMGVLAKAPRSATVVALEEDTQVEFLTEEDFKDFFQKNPARVFQLMQQMSHRLRRVTKEYVEECRKAYTIVENGARTPAEKG